MRRRSGATTPKWGERPLASRVVKWWLSDDVVFIDEVPKTSVGKFSEKDLRDRFDTHQLPVNDQHTHALTS